MENSSKLGLRQAALQAGFDHIVCLYLILGTELPTLNVADSLQQLVTDVGSTSRAEIFLLVIIEFLRDLFQDVSRDIFLSALGIDGKQDNGATF